jgi:YD repeat-containing protein
VLGEIPLLKTEYRYWSNGNLRQVIDGLGHATEIFYDSQFQVYPVCVKNALGHTTKTRYYGVPGSTENGCTTTAGTAAWNSSGALTSGAFFGQIEETADANDAFTSFSHDSWGRPVGIWRPGESKASNHAATVVFSYDNSGPFKVKHSQRDDLGGGNTATYLESYTFYDTFGRAVQTQSEAASAGKIIVANTGYNGLDQVVRQSLPYEVAATLGVYQSPNWSQPKTETSYDGLGRVLTVTNPNGAQRQTRYHFGSANREIGMVDELGHQQIQEIDAFGRLVKAKQYTVTVTGSPPVPNWSAAVYAETSYEYDAADRLERMVGPDGAETTIVYDALGRKISMNDPDMGVWLYRYDAAGNLRKQRDARNVMTCFHHDSLNRLTAKSLHPNFPDPDDPAGFCGNVLASEYDVTYGYDSNVNGIGRRTSATVYNSAGSVSNSTEWEYDERGRVVNETTDATPPGFASVLSYETDYGYDAADRVHTMTYPADIGAREIVTTTYNVQGLPYSLTSSTGATYVTSTTYDALGRMDQQMLGNALRVDRDYWGWDEAEGGGRLKRIFLLKYPYNSGDQADKLQDLMYRYDAAGNVTSIQDTINRSGSVFQRECFSYDALNRLTRGFTTGATTCNNNPSALGSGVYDQSYGYGSNGNLTSKTGVGSYTYNASTPQGCAIDTRLTKPHAVKIAGGATYTYDCNGNMTERTRSGVTVALSYDEENRLESVNDPSRPANRHPMSFAYDGDGQRVVMSNPNNGTVFVGNHMEASWSVTPMASPLGGFEAMPQGEDILVAWLTLFETDLLGFNLYRSTDTQAPDQQLNGSMILAQYPGSSTGAWYTWLDEEVEQGKSYYYWLELITSSGSEWHGPVEVGEGSLRASQSPQVTPPSSYKRHYYLGGRRIAMRLIK